MRLQATAVPTRPHLHPAPIRPLCSPAPRLRAAAPPQVTCGLCRAAMKVSATPLTTWEPRVPDRIFLSPLSLPSPWSASNPEFGTQPRTRPPGGTKPSLPPLPTRGWEGGGSGAMVRSAARKRDWFSCSALLGTGEGAAAASGAEGGGGGAGQEGTSLTCPSTVANRQASILSPRSLRALPGIFLNASPVAGKAGCARRLLAHLTQAALLDRLFRQLNSLPRYC